MTNRANILGIGNDIIEIDRIRQAYASHGQRFLDRLFTPEEQAYCLKRQDPCPSLAGRFCAKEAVVKALGCGFGKDASWLDIQILSSSEGKPLVLLSPALNKRFNQPQLLLSISHSKENATAVALWLSK